MENENKTENQTENQIENTPIEEVKTEKVEKQKEHKFANAMAKILPARFKTVPTGGYLGRAILYAIPVIGWIFLFIAIFDGENRRDRGFACAYLGGLLVIAAIIGIIIGASLSPKPQDTPIDNGPVVLHYASEARVTEATMKEHIAKELHLPDGTEFIVEGAFDLTKSGKYTLVCKWNVINEDEETEEKEKEVSVWVYDNDSTVEVNGEIYTVNTGTISMNYQKAVASENFTKCITITDSLGNQMTVIKESRSMSFEERAGKYLVFYTAVDGAGHQFNVRVLYDVTCEHQITVENGSAFTFEDVAKFSANFDGVTEIWLEDSKGNKIDAQHYYMDGDSLVLKKSYYGAFLGKRIAIKVCSEYSSDYFYATVYDEKGYDKYVYEYVVDSVEQSILCKKDGETFGYFAWPTVTKLDDGRLMAVSSGFRQAHIDTESKIAVWYSEDEGKTWSEPQVLVDTLLDDRDAGVVCWNGKIIVSWFCASKVYYLNNNQSKYSAWAATIDDAYDTKYMGGNYIVSEDGGTTWSEIYSMPDGMFTPHGLIVNPNGGLTSVGYLKYDKVNKTWGTGIGVRTTDGTMDENGFVWSEAIVIATDKEQNEKTGWDFQEPYGIYNDDGVLIVVMRSNKGLYQCELQPGATKFSEWRLIAYVQETPAHMIQHSSGVMIMTYGYRGIYIDPITGKTVSYTERNKDTTLGIRVRLSYDGGLTWTQEIILSDGFKPATNDNTSDWGYTSSAELSDGRIITVFYQRTGSETKASIHQIIWDLP